MAANRNPSARANREERFDIRLTEPEAASLREAAAFAGQSRTAYLRGLISGSAGTANRMSRGDLLQLIRRLTPIGVDLNDLIRLLGSGNAVDADQRLRLDAIISDLGLIFGELSRRVA